MTHPSRRFTIVSGLILGVAIALTGCALFTNNQMVATLPTTTPITNRATITVTQTPYKTQGTESSSTGISRSEYAAILPAEPFQISATLQKDSIVITWQGTGENVMEYGLFQKQDQQGDWVLISVIPATEENRNQYSTRYDQVTPGTNYTFALKAFAHYGRESAYSKDIAITAQ